MSSKWSRAASILKHGLRWRLSPTEMFLLDLPDQDIELILSVKPFTMTSPERIFGLINGVRYVIENQIPGSFVECGVWKGGSMMAVAKTLLQLNVRDRDLYLFDTFAGMTAPSENDSTSFETQAPGEAFLERKTGGEVVNWSYSPLEQTRKNMNQTGYPADRIHFIKGPVERTIPEQAPVEIALLRMDTDFYESSKHELVHLFPRLTRTGVLIVDDYGHWKGARLAVDEYFKKNKIPMLLNRVDYTGRVGIKT